MTTVISIIVAVGLVGFIIGATAYRIKTGDIKLLNTKEDVEEYERDCIGNFFGCWGNYYH